MKSLISAFERRSWKWMKSTRSIMFPKMCLFKTDKFLENLKIYKFLKNDAGIFPPVHHPERIGKPHPRSRARTYLETVFVFASFHRPQPCATETGPGLCRILVRWQRNDNVTNSWWYLHCSCLSMVLPTSFFWFSNGAFLQKDAHSNSDLVSLIFLKFQGKKISPASNKTTTCWAVVYAAGLLQINLNLAPHSQPQTPS